MNDQLGVRSASFGVFLVACELGVPVPWLKVDCLLDGTAYAARKDHYPHTDNSFH